MNNLNLTQQILPIAKELIFNHFDPNHFENKLSLQIENDNTNENSISITYLQWGNQTSIDNEEHLDEILSKYISQSLEKHNKVIIYTCRDNYNIAIEDINSYDEDSIEYLEESEIPELSGILFLAFD